MEVWALHSEEFRFWLATSSTKQDLFCCRPVRAGSGPPTQNKGGLMKILSRAKQLLDRLAKFYAGLLDFLLA